ncbi:hypothetical protein Q8A67_008649 [Cirrhinus molitorella]|uniref:Uncharacterized protein n=1 Tax=Cirrhinus molitorella TaxID=172907 RepID=A0AA88PQN6_9TELE|nr:hypothetical protein Q8A67_008649 [Cirrhinus molitorella]
MAEASILVGEDQFSCLICLELLKDPVTIPCGHSYCMSCISDCWNQDDKEGLYTCPECKQSFTPRPALNNNVMLAEMVDNLKKTRSAHGYAEPGDVECDVCTGRKRKAVKSCLLCLESYCQSHFDCHEESHPKKRHKVTDATGQIQEMICSKHDRLLEAFCQSDQKCICFICLMDEHKNHDTLSAEAERTEKQKQVEKTVTIIQKKIEERQTELQNLRESVQTHKRSAQAAVEDSERIFTELIHCIEKSRSEVIQMIRDREKAEVSRAEGLLKHLQQEIDDLRKRDDELKQLLHTENHIHFLQNFQFHAVPPASSDSTNISSLLSYDDVRRSVSIIRSKLEHFCREEIEKISGGAKIKFLTPITQPETREHFLHYYHPFTLDSETEREKEIQELKEAVKTHKHSALAAVKNSNKIFTELIRSIERSRSEVIRMIRDREKAEVNRAEGLLNQLQQEIDDLRRRDAELKQLLHTDDHIHFLQSFQSLSVPPASRDCISVTSLLSYDDVDESVTMLREKLEDLCKEATENIYVTPHVEIVTTSELRTRDEFLQYFRQLTLDPNTAHKYLHLSEGVV